MSHSCVIWLNRDPIAEKGWRNREPIQGEYDANLYGCVYNSPLNYIDPDGETGIAIPIPRWVWPKSPNPVNCAFAVGATVGTVLCYEYPETMTLPGKWTGD